MIALEEIIDLDKTFCFCVFIDVFIYVVVQIK